jgi:hypothetical protein
MCFVEKGDGAGVSYVLSRRAGATFAVYNGIPWLATGEGVAVFDRMLLCRRIGRTARTVASGFKHPWALAWDTSKRACRSSRATLALYSLR